MSVRMSVSSLQRESEAARLAAVSSHIDMQDYESVYFESKTPEEDSLSHSYDMVESIARL